jgi:hypothetical protein
MTSISKTAIVFNQPNKEYGLPEYVYRSRTFCPNLNSNTPASQYQRLKLIQNTVRVYASLYVSNLGPLEAYRQPSVETYGVCWNQMSDRPFPSVQRSVIPTGINCTLNRKHSSVTSSRPGCQAPGGVGVDIKHNSYDRYLNRLKGKGPLRRGVIPPTFGAPIPFNPAFPVYGGKTTKTNIVNGCYCPIGSQSENVKQDIQIYNNPYWQPDSDPVPNNTFNVGNYVYAVQNGNYYHTRAIILNIKNGVYLVKFDNGVEQIVPNVNDLLIYYPCNCNGQINNTQYESGFVSSNGNLEQDNIFPEYENIYT